MLGGISKIIKTIVGKLESVQKRKTIQLIGNKKVVKYDGNVHQVEGFVNETFLVDNKTFSVRYASYMATGKDFGSYLPKLEGNVTIYNSKGVDVTEKFEIEIIPGELRVEKRNIILQSASGVHEYDGQNYSLNSIEIKGDGLVNGEDIIYSCSGSLYLPGEVNNSIVCSFGIMTNPDNYNIELVEGNLKIVDRKIPYTIILEYPDQVFTYAGMEVQVEQPCEKNIVIDGINYIVKNILAKAEGKNVGEYDYVIDSFPNVYNEHGDDVTKQFSIEFKCGKLRIIPKRITLISNSGSKFYDGKPLTADGLIIDGLCEKDAIKYSIIGSQCEVGLCNNYFEYFFEPDELKSNYIVEKKYGVLEIKEQNKLVKNINNNEQAIPKIEHILADDNVNTLLGQLYSIDATEYENKALEELELSNRVMNRLQGTLGIHSVGELLNLSYAKLMDLKGFGKTSIIGIDEVLRKISKRSQTTVKNEGGIHYTPRIKKIIREHMDEIYHNNYEFCEKITFSAEEQVMIDRLKVATEEVDGDLLISAIENTETIVPVLNMLNDIVSTYNKRKKVQDKIQKEYINISENKRNLNIKWFVYGYTDDDDIRDKMLKEFHEEGIICIRDFMRINLSENRDLTEIIRFIKWCSFDIKEDVNNMFEKLFKNDREREIIFNRAKGNTLDTTGKLFGVTRERIRQIEKKVIKRFESLLNVNKIILKIYAERDGDEILTPSELAEYFEEKTEQILYLLRRAETSFYTYDSDLDVFVVGSSGLAERAQTYIDKLPEAFTEEKLDEIIMHGIKEYNLTEEIIRAHIDTEYQRTEKIYHRSRLTLQSIYDAVLKKYYPNGLWVYGEKDIEEFRLHIKKDYGNIVLPENNRALVAQVCRAGILCGRGTYKAKQSKYISYNLLKKIERYINTSDNSIFMMNTLFYVFEEELKTENVDNKYYLQGILHETFGKKWCFRRDYISKDEKITSIYTEIVTYIKKTGYPVKKQEIQKKYPGITEIVLNLATNDIKILNLFGSYIHGDNLKLSKEDITYLRNVVEKFLEKKDSWHCRSLYEYIIENNPIILKKNYINIPFGLYSLLEYCFRDEYNFSRPYIAKNGTDIVSTFEMLQEVVQSSDIMEIVDISRYARKNYHQINNILEFLDSCNETHFLINASEIASIDIIGITEETVNDIEKILDKEVSEAMPIRNLKLVHLLPKINVTWSEWLIYSAIKRWGKKYDVIASETQLKQSIPLIAPKGKMHVDNVNIMPSSGDLAIADDLNNIDDLIGDFDLEELGLDEL